MLIPLPSARRSQEVAAAGRIQRKGSHKPRCFRPIHPRRQAGADTPSVTPPPRQAGLSDSERETGVLAVRLDNSPPPTVRANAYQQTETLFRKSLNRFPHEVLFPSFLTLCRASKACYNAPLQRHATQATGYPIRPNKPSFFL